MHHRLQIKSQNFASTTMRNQALALLFVAIAAAAAYVCRQSLPGFAGTPGLLLLCAVVASTRLGSVRAGAVATILSAILLDIFFIPAHGTLALPLVLTVRTLLFFAVAGYLLYVFHGMQLAREQQTRAEAMCADFIRSAPVGFSLHRADGTYDDINPQLAAWNGVSREAHLGKRPSEVIPAMAAVVEENVRKVAETGQELVFEAQGDAQVPHGDRTWLACYFPVKNKFAKVEGVGTAVLEVTAERRALAALGASESRYRLLTESLPLYVWTTDPGGKIDFCNRHFLEFCGMTLETIQPEHLLALVHPEDLPALLEKIAASQTSGAPLEHEYRVHPHNSEEYRWHFAHTETFTDERGKQRGLGVALDVTSRRAAELETKAAGDRLNGILQSITESFIVLDRDWRFQYASARVSAQTGKSWEEMEGKVIWDLFPEYAHSDFRPAYEKVMRERVSQEFDVAYPAPNGTVNHYQVHAYPTSDGISVLVNDVTERKTSSDELERSRRLLHLVLDTAGVGTWVRDWNSGVITDLGNTAQLLGLEKVSSQGDVLGAVLEEDRSLLANAMAATLERGRLESEHRVQHRDGSIHRLRAIGSVLRDEDGNPEMLAGVVMDITERAKAEELQSRLAAIVDSSDDAIISKDLDGIITSWNRGATRIFGYSSEEMVGHSILRLIPVDLHKEEDLILSRLRNGQMLEHYETERVRKDGTLIQVSLTISPLRNADGRVIGASKIARDITDRNRMQDAMIASEKLAATGRMAAAIAHEINNPLEAVTNLAYLLSTDATLSGSGKQMAEMLLEEIDRVSHVAKQSLGFFRDSGKPIEFDICTVLDAVVELNRPLLEKKRIELVREYSGACLVFGSASEMRQVFSNLVRNAIEALEPGGRIRLRARAGQNGMQRVLIADNGHGIPRETLLRLFEPFVTTKGTAGNGLGLWVSRGIVKKHRGKMLVRTCVQPPHQGTVFVLDLPAAESLEPVESAEAPKTASST